MVEGGGDGGENVKRQGPEMEPTFGATEGASLGWCWFRLRQTSPLAVWKKQNVLSRSALEGEGTAALCLEPQKVSLWEIQRSTVL